MSVLPQRHRFTVEDYERIVEVGILGEDDRVADTSLRYDRDTKLPLYARYGIAEARIFDIPHTQVIVDRSPGPDGYSDITTVGARVGVVEASVDLSEARAVEAQPLLRGRPVRLR